MPTATRIAQLDANLTPIETPGLQPKDAGLLVREEITNFTVAVKRQLQANQFDVVSCQTDPDPCYIVSGDGYPLVTRIDGRVQNETCH